MNFFPQIFVLQQANILGVPHTCMVALVVLAGGLSVSALHEYFLYRLLKFNVHRNFPVRSSPGSPNLINFAREKKREPGMQNHMRDAIVTSQ